MVHMSNTFFVEMNRFVYTNRLHCCINTHPNIKFLDKKPIVFLVIQKKHLTSRQMYSASSREYHGPSVKLGHQCKSCEKIRISWNNYK